MESHLTHAIKIEKNEDRGYTAYAPSLPGCVTWGDTYDEAVAMAKDAIELYLKSVENDTEPLSAKELSVIAAERDEVYARRIDEIKSGKVVGIPHEDVMEMIQRKIDESGK